jgi:hypothetical protein
MNCAGAIIAPHFGQTRIALGQIIPIDWSRSLNSSLTPLDSGRVRRRRIGREGSMSSSPRDEGAPWEPLTTAEHNGIEA